MSESPRFTFGVTASLNGAGNLRFKIQLRALNCLFDHQLNSLHGSAA